MSLPPRRATPAPTRPATSTPPRLPHADTEETDMETPIYDECCREHVPGSGSVTEAIGANA